MSHREDKRFAPRLVGSTRMSVDVQLCQCDDARNDAIIFWQFFRLLLCCCMHDNLFLPISNCQRQPATGPTNASQGDHQTIQKPTKLGHKSIQKSTKMEGKMLQNRSQEADFEQFRPRARNLAKIAPGNRFSIISDHGRWQPRQNISQEIGLSESRHRSFASKENKK